MIVDPDFPDHPKTVKLVRALKMPAAPLMLLRIWAHCQVRRNDFLGRDPEDVAAICRWDGKAKVLLTALVTCGWIDESSDGYLAHGWRDINASWLAKIEGGKKRAAAAARTATGQLATSTHEASNQLAGQQEASLLRQAGSSAGAEERRGEENRREPPPLHAQAREGARACEDALAKTATLCTQILGQKRTRLGNEAERALAGFANDLPLSAEDEKILRDFYALPHDGEDVDLRSRYRNADRLAINLFAALETATAYFQRIGRIEKNPAQKNAAPLTEPAGCWEWFASRYPDLTRPANWFALPDSVRSEFALSA